MTLVGCDHEQAGGRRAIIQFVHAWFTCDGNNGLVVPLKTFGSIKIDRPNEDSAVGR